ncbi:MAG TPA: rhodanese-like domain-containing protein [Flavobacteriales bacterium]|nr:rhodanese-like domain-containing protein [Flavobacteriales bacterium]HRE73829.1 rhodanese-like domain-containing protein [Flavobacteriales bacterium]HRE96867.1 rhodanese-like domain-containing protein [Flavobacteriales bacterium]HRJ35809.1 rhodanese-like domain-containing protein [Flavobacteriales bacterium]HRJ38513.1 rhodanese-like domain-containing protein [Flavobacteriales bacterium]
MFGLIKNLFGEKTDFRALMKEGAIIIDVRTPQEYKGGHIKGSQNIPLYKIDAQVESIRKKGKPVITVCRSGGRSGMAADILRKKGIKVANGGPWNSLQRSIQ